MMGPRHDTAVTRALLIAFCSGLQLRAFRTLKWNVAAQ